MGVMSMHAVPPEPRRETSRKPGLQWHEYDPNRLKQSALTSHRTSWVPHSFTSGTGETGQLTGGERAGPDDRGEGAGPAAPTCCRHRHHGGAAPVPTDVGGDQPLQAGVDDPVDLTTSWDLTHLDPEDEESPGVQPAHARTHARVSREQRDRGQDGGQGPTV